MKIGFAGDLSGKEANLGISARDGVLLASEAVNKSGGIGGHPIQIIALDDAGQPAAAIAVDSKLIDAGVVGIIGHITSEQTLAGLSVTQPRGIVMLSPTTGTSQLTGQRDLFFRVISDDSQEAKQLALHIWKDRSIQSLAILYDSDNTAYSQDYSQSFKLQYTALGGRITEIQCFSGAEQTDFKSVLSELKTGSPAGLLIIASGLKSALVAQNARLSDWNVPLFITNWAYSDAYLTNGGREIEGTELVTDFDMDSQLPALLDFRRRYLAEFDLAPDFAAAQGYEAMLVLSEALQKTGASSTGLPQALLSIQKYNGLLGPLSFDAYGEIQRPVYLVQVKNGQFVTQAIAKGSAR
ncbi:MAG: ABC transporter substrate-binding protein [Anaerolineaceae bacterium]|nr:ABC transporter substrate-binding protein [Anaerolineaceae bacterium]